jgi:peroxiredoxin
MRARSTVLSLAAALAATPVCLAEPADAPPAHSPKAAEPAKPATTAKPADKPAEKPASPAEQPAPGLRVGETIPSLTLTNARGEPVDLAPMIAKGPVVVMFYRGGWCPFCNTALRKWQAELPALEKAGGTMIAITPETPDRSAKTAEKDALTYTVLSDTAGDAAKAFKVRFDLEPEIQTKYKGYGVDLSKINASGKWELPHPGTFVIDQGGVVRYASVNADYTKRADPADAVAAVKAITGR